MLFGNLSLIQTAVTAVSIYLVGWIVYCHFFHPLRSIPGPFLASISRAWVVFKTMRGDMEHTQRALHKKHGNDYQRANAGPQQANETGYLVRIAPNEVACSDPEAIKVIALSWLLPNHSLTHLDYLQHEDHFYQGPYLLLIFMGEAHSLRPITTMLGPHRTMDTSVISLRVMKKSILSADVLSIMSTRCPASLNPKRP